MSNILAYNKDVQKQIEQDNLTVYKALLIARNGFSRSPFKKMCFSSSVYIERFEKEKENGVGTIFLEGLVVTHINRKGRIGSKSIVQVMEELCELIDFCVDNDIGRIILPLITLATDGMTLGHMDDIFAQIDTKGVIIYVG